MKRLLMVELLWAFGTVSAGSPAAAPPLDVAILDVEMVVSSTSRESEDRLRTSVHLNIRSSHVMGFK